MDTRPKSHAFSFVIIIVFFSIYAGIFIGIASRVPENNRVAHECSLRKSNTTCIDGVVCAWEKNMCSSKGGGAETALIIGTGGLVLLIVFKFALEAYKGTNTISEENMSTTRTRTFSHNGHETCFIVVIFFLLLCVCMVTTSIRGSALSISLFIVFGLCFLFWTHACVSSTISRVRYKVSWEDQVVVDEETGVVTEATSVPE